MSLTSSEESIPRGPGTGMGTTFEGPRGLHGFLTFDDGRGDTVQVQESSSAEHPAVWLRIIGEALLTGDRTVRMIGSSGEQVATVSASAHLDYAAVLTIRNAMDDVLRWMIRETSPAAADLIESRDAPADECESSGQWCGEHGRHNDDPDHTYDESCWFRQSSPGEEEELQLRWYARRVLRERPETAGDVYQRGLDTASDAPIKAGDTDHGPIMFEPRQEAVSPDDLAVKAAPEERVDHPSHYGGDTIYETIKVCEAWGLDADAYLFNTVKYVSRAGQKGDHLTDLRKARFYLDRRIKLEEGVRFHREGP